MSLRVLAPVVGFTIVLSFSAACVLAQDSAAAEKPPKAGASSDAAKADPDSNASVKGNSSKSATKKAGAAKGKATKSAAADKDTAKSARLEKATFGGGCFWCMEAVYEGIPGVKSVVSGYAGGIDPRPVYEVVSTGITGHAEVVQVIYDPDVVSYKKLLDIFWKSHDPTTLNRQGPDEGTQYRSIILYHSDEQRKEAMESYKKITAARVFADPIVTELVPLKKFFPAERHHQDYYRKHRNAEYSQIYIAPKLQNLKFKLSQEQQAQDTPER